MIENLFTKLTARKYPGRRRNVKVIRHSLECWGMTPNKPRGDFLSPRVNKVTSTQIIGGAPAKPRGNGGGKCRLANPRFRIRVKT